MHRRAASLGSLCARFCLASFAILPLPNTTFGQSQTQGGKPTDPALIVKVHVVELNLRKLRTLGVDIRSLLGTEFLLPLNENKQGNSGASSVLDFCKALGQGGCAQIIAEPELGIVGGRDGSLKIDDHLRLKITPSIVENRSVELEYDLSLSLANSPSADRDDQVPGNGQFTIASNFVGDIGKTHCLSATKSWMRDDQGILHESVLLVFLSATPAELHGQATAEAKGFKDVPQR